MVKRSRLVGHAPADGGCQCGDRPDPPTITRAAYGRWRARHIIDLRLAAAEQAERAAHHAELALYRKVTN